MNAKETQNLAKTALEYANRHDLVPLISFYLESELTKKLIKKLEKKLLEIYNKYKYSRDLFIKEATKVLDSEQKYNFTHFIYYAFPISEKIEALIVKNNWIPPKVVILNGKVRFTFMPYANLEEIEKAIKTQNEDDIIVEFENGIVKSYDRKRNIFTDFRSVSEVLTSKQKVVLNLFVPLESILSLVILSNNVYPLKNKIEIKNENGKWDFYILEGRATKDDVLDGKTLTAESKAEIYYDFKKGYVDQKTILNGLIFKLPIL